MHVLKLIKHANASSSLYIYLSIIWLFKSNTHLKISTYLIEASIWSTYIHLALASIKTLTQFRRNKKHIAKYLKQKKKKQMSKRGEKGQLDNLPLNLPGKGTIPQWTTIKASLVHSLTK